MRIAAGFALAIGAGIALASLSGCKTTTGAQGQSGVVGTHAFSTVRCTLPEEVKPAAVNAAAVQALRSRGYTVMSSTMTTDKCRIEAVPAGIDPFEQITVEARVVGGGAAGGAPATELSVKRDPWADEALVRTILDAILQRLGR
jgi:hypothetical protein